MKKIIMFLYGILIPFVCTSQIKEEFRSILKQSDLYRGGGIPGISWELKIQNYKQDNLENELFVTVEASTKNDKQYALVTFNSPKKFIGQKLLLREHNMWFIKKGLRQPIPISSRQRVSGSAANADLVSSNYYADYTINNIQEKKYIEHNCYMFELIAKNNLVSYTKIYYWIRIDDKKAVKAEYFGKSGKLIKIATFEYHNNIKYQGVNYKFISEMDVFDIVLNQNTKLLFSKISFPKYDNLKFQKENIN